MNNTTDTSQSLLPEQRSIRIAVLVVLMIAGLALRLYGITVPPTEFHPLRQFRSALIARSYYLLDNSDNVPEWRLDIARDNLISDFALEPTIVEYIASVSYGLVGQEVLWLPRLYSVIFWLIGGGLLFRLGKKLISPDAALVATLFYLLLPFTVLASRSFQPDPLMIMLFLLALNVILWFDDKPTWGRLVAAGLVSSMAPFVKPITLFTLFFCFLSLRLYRQRHWKAVISPQAFVFGLLMFLPTGLYYLSSLLAGSGIKSEVDVQFLPGLLITREFWAGWFTQVGKVFGPLTFLAGGLGLVIRPRDRATYFLAAWWAGYIVNGLILSYTTFTHDYYQLQLVPAVGLCLAAVVIPVFQRLRQMYPARLTRAALIILVTVVLAQFSAYENWWRNFYRVYYESMDSRVATYGPEIGELVDHSRHVIFVSEAYGRPLRYYAEISGTGWIANSEQQIAALKGQDMPTASEIMESLTSSIDAEYIIVTEFGELVAQPGLKALLASYPVAAQTDFYVIYRIEKDK